MNKKLIRITTIPMSLKYLLKGQMSFMGKNGFEVIMISSDGKELKDVIENEKCKHFVIPFTRKITPLKDLIATFSLYRFLIREKPEIVHTHTPKAGIVGMIAAFLARVPVRLHTVAGLPLMEAVGLKRVVLNFVEKLTYKCSTKVYPNSFGLKNIILKNRFTTEDKLRVIGIGSSNGIDTSYFDPELFSCQENNTLKSELGIERNDFVFIFVGRLVADKGINELVEAFNELCLDLKGIKLLLVGPFEDELDPLSEKTKLLISSQDKIISVGYQNDVRPFFAVSNTLVFPSYREGFPNVPLQCGAFKKAMILSDISGCNEIVTHQKSGLLVRPKLEKEVYSAMRYMLNNTEERINFGRDAYTHVTENFEQSTVWQAQLESYNSLIKNR